MIEQAKLNIRNFGATKIFVISDKENIQRRNDFKDAWSNFKNFDYEFVDAIMGKDLDITKLIQEKKILGKFYDPNGTLSKNLLASIFLSDVWIIAFKAKQAEG